MKIYGVASMASGADMARGLLAAGFPLTGMIGLAPGDHGDKVSAYLDLTHVCADLGLDHIAVGSYGLRDPADKARLLAEPIDLLVIMGWQRLLPDWLLAHARFGGIGLHGSADGITGGRGRSPQNWALMLGKEAFHLSIFFLDPAVDSGPIIDSRAIPLTQWDDIRTSYYKVSRAANEMIAAAWSSGRIERREAAPQEGAARYLPKREPEDGAIDWRRSAAAVHDFVRALTRPYPGAFSAVDGATVKILRGRPFGSAEDFGGFEPGDVIDLFEYGEVLIRTGDGAYLVDEHEPGPGAPRLAPGVRLESADWPAQMRRIAERHLARYPDAPLAADILREAGLEG